MFQIEYFYRWNERIVAPTQGDSGVSGNGAISEIIDVNLAPNRLLISDQSGKIIVSSLVTAEEAQTLQGISTGETIQEQLDGKQDVLTLGNLTEATSSVLTITGGTGAIIGSGLSIQVKAASAIQSGYLSSTDWNTFNNKLSTSLTSARIFVGNGSNVATGVAVSGDITINSSGLVGIAAGVIVDADFSPFANVQRSRLATGTAYRILSNNIFGIMSENAALTASRAIASDANGQLQVSATTFTQLGYSSNLTGDIQAQLDDEIATKTVTAIVKAPTIAEHGFAITWDNTAGKYTLTDPVIQGIPAAGSTSQVLMKYSGLDYEAAWTSILLSHVSDVNASAADVDVLVGADAASITPTIIGYLGGSNPLNSSLQDQLDGKQSSSLAQNAIWVGNGSNIAAALASGTSGYVLTSVSGVPTWQPPTSLSDGDKGDVVVSGSGATWTIDTTIAKAWTGAHSFLDNNFSIFDNSDNTKIAKFELSGISTATTRTFTLPNFNGTVVASGGTNALAGNTIFSGNFNFQLGTSGSKLSSIELYGNSTITVDSGSQLDLVGFSNVLIEASSDQVIIDPGTSIKVVNSSSPPSSFGDIDSTYIYSKDISASSELFVMNEAGVECQLTANIGSAPSTSIGAAIVNYYGSSATNFLGDPVAWMVKKIGATTYKIPLYT